MKLLKIGVPLLIPMLVAAFLMSRSFPPNDATKDVNEFRTEALKNLPPGSDVRQVTQFLDSKGITYSKDFSRLNTKFPVMISGYSVVKHGFIDSTELSFTFSFDDQGKLTDIAVHENTNGL